MQVELNRLATFSKCAKTFHSNPLKLARCGFYYSTISDKLMCHACNGSVSDLSDEKNAVENHRHISPSCNLHNKKDFNNSPLVPSFPMAPGTHDGVPDSFQDIFASAMTRASVKRLFNSDSEQTIDRIEPNFDVLRSERVRLSTFHDWPSTANADPVTLSREGLFYRGIDDKVQCAFCRGSLSKWQPNDVPRLEHTKHFPDCPFVRGIDVDNVTIEQETSQSESSMSSITAANTSLKQIERGNEPRENMNQVTEMLSSSAASLHLQNQIPEAHDSNQRELNMDTGLGGWMDSPAVRAVLDMGYPADIVEAALSIKTAPTGTDYPNAVSLLETIFRLQEGEQKTRFNHNSFAATSDITQLSAHDASSSAADENDFPAPTADDHHGMASATSDNCSVMEPSIEQTMSKDSGIFSSNSLSVLLPSSMSSAAAENLIESTTLQSAPDVLNKRKDKKKKKRRKPHLPDSASKDSEQGQTVESDIDCKTDDTSDIDAVKFLEENRQLREARTCKVCMDAEVNTVFLPCGHLVCCTGCSRQLRDCPVCRIYIRGTVKTFLT